MFLQKLDNIVWDICRNYHVNGEINIVWDICRNDHVNGEINELIEKKKQKRI